MPRARALRFELIVPPDGDTTLRGHLFLTRAEAEIWLMQPGVLDRGYRCRPVRVPYCACCRSYHRPENCDADAET